MMTTSHVLAVLPAQAPLQLSPNTPLQALHLWSMSLALVLPVPLALHLLPSFFEIR